MKEGGFSLNDILDFDTGMTAEEFMFCYQNTYKLQAEASRTQVQNFTVAIGSAFDKKIFKRFDNSITKIVKKLEEAQKRPYLPDPKKDRKAAMAHTMKELSKLQVLFNMDADGMERLS